jgi:hypothetical protein
MPARCSYPDIAFSFRHNGYCNNPVEHF